MGIVEEECDESLFWMELLVESGIVPANRLHDLRQEAEEILKITITSAKTAKSN